MPVDTTNDLVPDADPRSTFEYDPAYLNSLREMRIMLSAWGTCLCWTIGYCWLAAGSVSQTDGEAALMWGFPSWVTIGVIIPWILCGFFSVCFALFGIAEDDEDSTASIRSLAENRDAE